MIKELVCPILCAVLLGACIEKQSSSVETPNDFSPSYAKGYQIESVDNYTLLTLGNVESESAQQNSFLLHSEDLPDSVFPDYTRIKIPVNSIVSNSTTHLTMLEILGVENLLKGFAQTRYISSEKIIALVEQGEIREVGKEAQLNTEIILDIAPDAVLAYSTQAENKQLGRLKELGVNIMTIADYKENSVLGRAEWIKVIGLITGKQDMADDYFTQLVIRFDSLKKLVNDQNLPTVMSGTLYGGTWFMPGGKNYNSQLIADAGGQYLWEENDEKGWLNLDFEAVYNQCWQADFWIGAANYESLDQMKETDERYADFEAFKKGQIYTYIGRVNKAGANDYFESGNINPDKLLADYIKIIHPDLLPDYELYYYYQLK